MTARDKYQVGVKCPECGNSAVAHLSENDGASYQFGRRDRQVDKVPEGFEVVNQGREHNEKTVFRCKCGTFASPESLD